MITTDRLIIGTFTKEYLQNYFENFDGEITRYQYPDPFKSLSEADSLLSGFIDEAARGETFFAAILLPDREFVGSIEVHGLKGDLPEIGIWVCRKHQGRGMPRKRWMLSCPS